jgi:hypothetical protein
LFVITKAVLPDGFSICVAFKRTLRLKPEVFRSKKKTRRKSVALNMSEVVLDGEYCTATPDSEPNGRILALRFKSESTKTNFPTGSAVKFKPGVPKFALLTPFGPIGPLKLITVRTSIDDAE